MEESPDQKTKGCSLRSLKLQRREGAGVIILWPSSTQRGPIRQKDGDRAFSKAFCDGRWGMVLN